MSLFKRLATLCLVVGMAIPLAGRAAEEAPGTFKIPGTDTTAKIYGYAQLDITYDLRSRTPDSEGFDWANQAAIVPLDGSAVAKNQSKQLYMTARTSRFGIETTTPTAAGTIGVKLEGDFNSPNPLYSQSYTNSVLFRLRQGYGTITGGYGTFLAGQTWTTFLDLASYPDVVDFNGPGTIPLIRQPMLKYTTPSMSGFTLSVAAENAPGQEGNDLCYDAGDGTAVCGATAANSGTVTGLFQTIPDFAGDLRTSGAWGHLSLRGVVRNIRVADISPTAVPNGAYKEAWAGAASVGGSLKFAGDTLVYMVVAGAPGRYEMNNVGNGGSRGVVTTATGMFPWDSVAYHVGYTHVWSPVFRSNLVWSQSFFKPNEASSDISGANQRIDQAFFNTFWTFAKNAEWGIEYTIGQRHTFADRGTPSQVGTVSRINSTFHYNFY